ncbi:hypothetical protein [Modestobacter roseus]|uniref:RIO1 family protein n=1 Tax=Modestobacter roseus TaxID=1181884 RepID=A0A562INU6_9ACTN|nr:hypothetical protein [Modestobacter roseus]MQA35412.1 hypothetical protein [Modestobacter roseus]TWH72689.1 hypothetical protein JD78_01211 [Modestobacter roseus]
METMPRRPAVPPTARRPGWPVGSELRRPSGADRAGPRRVRREVWGWAAVLLLAVVGQLVLSLLGDAPARRTVDREVRAVLLPGPLDHAWHELAELGHLLGPRVLWVPTVLVLVWVRRWRHLRVYLGTVSVIAAVAVVASHDGAWALRVREGLVGSPDELSLPSWPVLVMAAVSVATVQVLVPPGRARRWGWAAAVGLLVVCTAAAVAQGWTGASAGVVAALSGASAAGLAITLLAPPDRVPVTYRRRVPAHLTLDAERTGRVLAAVRDQLGLPAVALEPYRLDGSAGSTPCRLRLAEGPTEALFGKLYSSTHLRSDRWYKFFRVLRYGRLEDEAPFSSVRRLVEHEDYMLRLLRDGGVQVPEPLGVVEVVPGQEYLLVTELVPDSVELLDSGLPDPVLDDALRQVGRLWVAGAAHRDIKPSNVLARGDRVFLVDVSFGELRPSRWRQSVDLANMLLTLGLGAEPAHVLERARLLFGDGDLAEALATTSSVTVPRQLQRRIHAVRPDLVAELRGLLPSHPRIRVQRWSVRRVLLAVGSAASVVVVAGLVGLDLRAGGLL